MSVQSYWHFHELYGLCQYKGIGIFFMSFMGYVSTKVLAFSRADGLCQYKFIGIFMSCWVISVHVFFYF